MLEIGVEWAIDVARMLRARGLVDSGSERSAAVVKLLNVLLQQPPPQTWRDVISQWQSDATPLSRAALDQRVRRVRMLLTRAMAGLNTEQLKGSPQFRSRVQTTNELITATLLLNSGAHSSARATYDHALKVSSNYHITDCAIHATVALRRLAANSNDASAFRKHSKALTFLQKIQEVEWEAEQIEDAAITLLHRYGRSPQSISNQLKELADRLHTLVGIGNGLSAKLTTSDREFTSVVAERIWYRVQLWRASLTSRPHDMLAIGTQAIAWLNDHPEAHLLAYLLEFEGSRMSAMLMLKDSEGARKAWSSIRQHIEAGTGNWVGFLQLYFLVCTSAKNFVDARDALHEYDTKKQRGGTPWRAQLWMLYKAYVFLLIDEGIVPPGPFARSSRIYVAGLESSCKDLVRDKPTTNAALLILKTFHLLRAHKYSEIIASADTMRSYASRYLRNPQTARTGYFLRMLATLPASDFEPKAAFLRGKSLLSKATSLDPHIRDDAEIIPYEVLWELVFGVLHRNIETRRRRR